MARTNIYLYLPLATLFIFSYAQSSAPISESLNTFAFNVLDALSEEVGESSNIALSPHTLWTLLSVISEGAKGKTANELDQALQLPVRKGQFRNKIKQLLSTISKPDVGVSLETSNAAFTDRTAKLKPRFQALTKKYYNVDAIPVDFQNGDLAAEVINDYVAKATHNRIKNFVRTNDIVNTEILLTSTLYFKAGWTEPFNKSWSKVEPFYNEKGVKVGDVTMMARRDPIPYTRVEDLKSHAIELPYGNNSKVSMYVLLPFKSGSIDSLLKDLTKYSFDKIMQLLDQAAIDFPEEPTIVHLPRFSITSDLKLNNVLKKLGITYLFDQYSANLSGMIDRSLYVSQVFQKAEIEVNEDGATASSASGGSIENKTQPPKFFANRPFLYFIANKETKSVIFCGKVSNPTVSKVAENEA